MLFHSVQFFSAFLPITLVIYLLLRSQPKARLAIIALASVVYYSYWKWQHTPVLVLSILVNYGLYLQLYRTPVGASSRFWLLLTGLCYDLGVLGYFKYLGWFASLWNGNDNAQVFEFVSAALPIGISFYTFQQISCLVDVYRQGSHSGKKYSFLEFAAYVMFFPQLIAGPIVRASTMMDQFRSRKSDAHYLFYFLLGILFFAVGFVKKTYLADNIGVYATQFFEMAHNGKIPFVHAWFGVFSYTFQIYFDFSGYAEMAVGLGFLFGLKLPMNFRAPFLADSPIDYWRRWHITLSEFLRDYVFGPISMWVNRLVASYRLSRTGFLIVGSIIPLIVTFFLSGLWHGASVLFLYWGLYHGVLVAINQLWRQTKLRIPKLVSIPATFLAVAISFVWFRAPSEQAASRMFHAMVNPVQQDYEDLAAWCRQTWKMVETVGVSRVLSPIPFEAPDESRNILFLILCALVGFAFPKLNALWEGADEVPRWLIDRTVQTAVVTVMCAVLPIVCICLANYMSVIGTFFPDIKFVYFDF